MVFRLRGLYGGLYRDTGKKMETAIHRLKGLGFRVFRGLGAQGCWQKASGFRFGV